MQIDEYRCVKHVWSVSCAWQHMHVGVLLWLTISQSQLLNRLAWFFYLQMLLFTAWEEWPWMRPAALVTIRLTLLLNSVANFVSLWLTFSPVPSAWMWKQSRRCSQVSKISKSQIVQIWVFVHCLQAFKPWKPQVNVSHPHHKHHQHFL